MFIYFFFACNLVTCPVFAVTVPSVAARANCLNNDIFGASASDIATKWDRRKIKVENKIKIPTKSK
jgi:hypothetical protein